MVVYNKFDVSLTTATRSTLQTWAFCSFFAKICKYKSTFTLSFYTGLLHTPIFRQEPLSEFHETIPQKKKKKFGKYIKASLWDFICILKCFNETKSFDLIVL